MRASNLRVVAGIAIAALAGYWFGRHSAKKNCATDVRFIADCAVGLPPKYKQALAVDLLNSTDVRPSMYGMHISRRHSLLSSPPKNARSGYDVRPYRAPFVGSHVSVFIVDDTKDQVSVLLGYNPGEKRYELVGGYMQPMGLKQCGATEAEQKAINAKDKYDETLHHTAQRETYEETGLMIPLRRFIQTETRSGIEQNKTNAHSVDAFYYAEITQAELESGKFGSLKAGDDVAKVVVVSIDKLDDFAAKHTVRKDHLEELMLAYERRSMKYCRPKLG